MRPIATDDPVEVCLSYAYAVLKQLNGPRSSLGWRLRDPRYIVLGKRGKGGVSMRPSIHYCSDALRLYWMPH